MDLVSSYSVLLELDVDRSELSEICVEIAARDRFNRADKAPGQHNVTCMHDFSNSGHA